MLKISAIIQLLWPYHALFMILGFSLILIACYAAIFLRSEDWWLKNNKLVTVIGCISLIIGFSVGFTMLQLSGRAHFARLHTIIGLIIIIVASIQLILTIMTIMNKDNKQIEKISLLPGIIIIILGMINIILGFGIVLG